MNDNAFDCPRPIALAEIDGTWNLILFESDCVKISDGHEDLSLTGFMNGPFIVLKNDAGLVPDLVLEAEAEPILRAMEKCKSICITEAGHQPLPLDIHIRWA